MESKSFTFSSEFAWRRVQSLTGLWLLLYLFLHLLTNSQAALFLNEDGLGFIRMVNSLENLPYLKAIETLFIFIPILVHAIFGIRRALQAKMNHRKSDGSSPSLNFSRNQAFAWQRISSWILLLGIGGHIFQMCFWSAPTKIGKGVEEKLFVTISLDEGIETLAKRLHVELFSSETIESFAKEHHLTSFNLKKDELIAVTSSPGIAYLLIVRDTFKSLTMAALYTIFLFAAIFHAANGFWTFLITWGFLLSYRSQRSMIPVSVILMAVLGFFGLAAVWWS